MDILPVDDSLLQVGQWATLALIPGQRRDTAKNTFVVSVTHYKCHTEEQHEKLLLILKTPRDGASPSKMTYVVTDRGPNTHDVDSQRCQASSMLLSSASPSSRVISPLSPDVRANDRIFIPGTGAPSLKRYKRQLSQRYNALCTMTLTTAMSLAQLAVLLQAVNLHSVYYNLLKYQCYWYAYTIWEVLHMEFGGIVTENKLQDKRGKYMGFNIAHEDSVEAITGIYTCAWWKLCEEAIQIRKNEEELVRQAEARGEARERARHEEEPRRLDIYRARQLEDEEIRQAEVQGAARERARYEAELQELNAYRTRIGPLNP